MKELSTLNLGNKGILYLFATKLKNFFIVGCDTDDKVFCGKTFHRDQIDQAEEFVRRIIRKLEIAEKN